MINLFLTFLSITIMVPSIASANFKPANEKRVMSVSNKLSSIRSDIVVDQKEILIKYEEPEDYNKKIASKLFNTASTNLHDDDGFISITPNKTKNIAGFKKGEKFKLILPHSKQQSWIHEIESPYIEFIKKEQKKDETILFFQAKKIGVTKLYLDCIKNKKAVEAKRITISVSK